MKKNIRKSRRVTHAEIPKDEMNKWGYPRQPRHGGTVWLAPGVFERECEIVYPGWRWKGFVPYEGVKQSLYRWVLACEGCDSPRCMAKAEEEE